MPKKKKPQKNYKQFTILTNEDGMAVLGSLINDVVVNLKKYKDYAIELNVLCEKYAKVSNESEDKVLIPANEYDDINDKLLYRQRELLKCIADCQKVSFSYITLRKLLTKNKLLSAPIEDKIVLLLNEFLDVRNWTFHNPQSRMVAMAEVAKKSIPDELKGMVNIQPQINPLIITHVSSYDFLMLLSLASHVERRTAQFELVLKQMKSDYEEMYERIENKPIYIRGPRDTSKVIYFERNYPTRFASASSDVSQISMAIQKSKYDGSTDSYNEWAINKTMPKEDDGKLV